MQAFLGRKNGKYEGKLILSYPPFNSSASNGFHKSLAEKRRRRSSTLLARESASKVVERGRPYFRLLVPDSGLTIRNSPESTQSLNAGITVAALVVGAAQLLFVFNLVWSVFKGKESGGNPWRATTLEWQTPETPPKHGNWGPNLPVVHRWAYDYSVPGASEDFTPQNQPADAQHPVGSGDIS